MEKVVRHIESSICNFEEQKLMDELKIYWSKLDTIEKKVSCINSMWVKSDPISSCKAIANLFATLEMYEVLEVFPLINLEIQCNFVTTIHKTDMDVFMSMLPYETSVQICLQLESENNPAVQHFTIYKKMIKAAEDISREDAALKSERLKFEALVITSMRDELLGSTQGLVIDMLDELYINVGKWRSNALRMKDKNKSEEIIATSDKVTETIIKMNYPKMRKSLLDTVSMIERTSILRYNSFVATEIWHEYNINGDHIFAIMDEFDKYTAERRKEAEKYLNTCFKALQSVNIAANCIMLKVYDIFIVNTCNAINGYMKNNGLYDKAKSLNLSRIHNDQIKRASESAGRILSEIGIERTVVNDVVNHVYLSYFRDCVRFIFTEQIDYWRQELRKDFFIWYSCMYVFGELDRPMANNSPLTHEFFFLSKVLPYADKGGMVKARFQKDVKAIRDFAASNGLTTVCRLKEELPRKATIINGKRFNLPTIFKMAGNYATKFPGPSFTGYNGYYEKFRDVILNNN